MNVLVLLFAILMCLVNSVLWTVYTDMPIAGIGWLGAAVGCVYLRKWSTG